MKKSLRKLTLNKETLRSLEEPSLLRAAGANTRGLPCSEGPSFCISICVNCIPSTEVDC